MASNKEERDAPSAKFKGLKDAAEGAARKAMDMLPDQADATDFLVWQKLAEMRERAAGQHEEAQRGMAAKENIMSSMGTFESVRGAIKERLTQPTDVVNMTRAAREEGSAHRKDPTGTVARLVSVEKPEFFAQPAGDDSPNQPP